MEWAGPKTLCDDGDGIVTEAKLQCQPKQRGFLRGNPIKDCQIFS